MPISYRSLPRVFISGASPEGPIALPKDEVDKLRKVLRLSDGAKIAVLPANGTLIVAEFKGNTGVPLEVLRLQTEPNLHLTLIQALPKGDKLDEIIRACTSIGVSRFVLFPSDRTIVHWDDKKLADRMQRFQTIAKEAAEVSFRMLLPEFRTVKDLGEALQRYPDAVVLSEVEGVPRQLERQGDEMSIVVGPEGGWAARELELIGTRAVTLGPRVLRVEHAGPAAAALLLLR